MTLARGPLIRVSLAALLVCALAAAVSIRPVASQQPSGVSAFTFTASQTMLLDDAR